jgi:hypothetical protein
MPALKKILDQIDENNKDLKFAGMHFLASFANQELVQVK